MDHYGLLGLQRGCSLEQVITQIPFWININFFFGQSKLITLSLMFLIIQVQVAYRSKVEELTKQELDEEELNKKVELLKVSNWKLPFYKRKSNV